MHTGIGLVFPGQGSQSVGMGKALCEAYPHLKQVYDEASTVLGYDVAALCFEGPAEKLNLTEHTQPALLVSSIAALRALQPAGIKPVAVAGHSLGEYSALVAAGGITYRDAVGIVQKRGQYMSEAVPAGTGFVAALLGLAADVVREVCREAASAGVVQAANFNSPGQVVIAGEKAAVERAIDIAKTKGCKKAIPLPVSVPVHTPLMQQAADRLAKDLAAVTWSDLAHAVDQQCRSQADHESQRHPGIAGPPTSVLGFVGRLGENHGGDGREDFIEVGPGTVLTGLIKRIVPEAATMNVNDPKSLDATRAALKRVRGKE